MQVRLNQSGVKFRLNDRKKLKAFIPKIFSDYKKTVESIDIIFCSDAFLLKINQKFLQHNYHTDIITFNLAEPKSPIIGELYISIETVKKNAQALDISFKMEIHRVIFHGVLHLCGYTDKAPKAKISMTARENYYLQKYLNVPRIPF